MTTPIGSMPSPLLAEITRPPARLETAVSTPPSVGGAAGASEGGFEGRVVELLDAVSDLQNRATEAGDGYLRGAHDDVHGTMIAMQEADVSLRFATNIRNRVIDAYREVMRMGA